MSGFLAYALLLVGLALGAARPRNGLAVFVGLVAVTPTLPWQLGMQNLAYPLAYGVGLLIGASLGGVALARPRAQPGRDHRLDRCVGALLILMIIPTLRALIVRGPLGSRGATAEIVGSLGSLAAFNPDRVGGVLQALAIGIVGLLLFNLARALLDTAAHRRQFERYFVAGAAVALAAPPVQLLLLDPTVRPDKGLLEAAGWVGWFQDPHAFAAYLVLAVGLLMGVGARRWRSGVVGIALFLPWALAVATFVAVNGTSSRSGLASWLGVLALFLFSAWVLVPGDKEHAANRRFRLRAAAATMLVMFVAGAALWTSPALRSQVHASMSGLGNPRMWEFLDPDGPENPLFGRRLLMWRKAAILIEQHPLWGVGAQGYIDTPVELSADTLAEYAAAMGEEELRLAMIEYPVEQAHNYYLQFAAEYGLPGVAGLFLLFGSIVASTARRWTRVPPATQYALLGAGSGLVGLLVMSVTSHPLLLAEMGGVFWIVAGYMVRVGTDSVDRFPDP